MCGHDKVLRANFFFHVERLLCGPLLRSIYRNLGNEDLWWSPTNLTCKKGGIEVIAHTHIMVILKKKNKLQGNSKLGHFSISIETKVPLPTKIQFSYQLKKCTPLSLPLEIGPC